MLGCSFSADVAACMQVESLARAMELGEEAAERVTKEFPPPVKLEFEKVRSCQHSLSRRGLNLFKYPVPHSLHAAGYHPQLAFTFSKHSGRAL